MLALLLLLTAGGTVPARAASRPAPAPALAPLAPTLRAFAPPAGASIASLTADIWPEHDDPRVLVIYRGTLSPTTPLPQTLAFPIPPSGQVNAAAYRGADGQLLSAQYEYRQQGGRLVVVFQVPAREFQFEYYGEAAGPEPRRRFAVGLEFPLPVGHLRVAVEQPARATGFTLSPAAQSTIVTSAGLTHHVFTVPGLPAGRVWQVRIAYQKPDRTPSFPRATALPPAPARAGLPWWFWAGGAAVLGLAAVAAALYLRQSRGLEDRARRHRAAGAPAPPDRAAEDRGRRSRGDTRACPACGTRVAARDRFCRHCGQALQTRGG